jgi:hydrogenase nickel incorporation protein HypA/HybF
MPEALQFAFDASKSNTVAENAQLVIEPVPVSGVCLECKKDFTVDNARFIFACPLCGSQFIEMKTGREMEIVDMEINE